ncbi:DoxX family protein [Rhodobacteraceae bacterium W635]|uniref:DoxX family protein n=1 Tax=Nioella halotolerans TaxID=2303578 RepID=UPI000E3DCA1B|nr:DoxX family protein [Rhodobacteraceae bacterium W635]
MGRCISAHLPKGDISMSTLETYAHPAGRVLLALIFIVAGFGKLGDVQGFSGYLASGGLPAFLAWPAVLFEIIAGLALAVGFMTRPVALALAAFSIVTAFLYHLPVNEMQQVMFLKNLAMTGGYLLLVAHGAGALSVDRRRGGAAFA